METKFVDDAIPSQPRWEEYHPRGYYGDINSLLKGNGSCHACGWDGGKGKC